MHLPQKKKKIRATLLTGTAALKFFRTLVSLQDTFYQAQMTHNNTFGLILNIVYETMPRDNLLNSACLELFEYIKRENIKPIILHVVEKYRDKLKDITYVDTFRNLILRYDQMQGYGAEGDASLYAQDEGMQQRNQVNGQRWQGVKEMDAAEEEYFNTSDDEEEVGFPHDARDDVLEQKSSELTTQWQQDNRPGGIVAAQTANGSASPVVKPLVDYPDDDEDVMDTKPEPAEEKQQQTESTGREMEPSTAEAPTTPTTPVSAAAQTPPERLSEKRRREEEEDDELVKLSSGPKRRSSSSSSAGTSGFFRRKNSFSSGSTAAADKGAGQNVSVPGTPSASPGPKKIAINLGPSALKSVGQNKPSADESIRQGNNDNRTGDRGG